MSLLDGVTNYYERLVVESLERVEGIRGLSEDMLEDIICVALNRLPPRYYRHSVDLVFYMSDGEEAEIRRRVEEVVKDSVEFVKHHQRKQQAGNTGD